MSTPTAASVRRLCSTLVCWAALTGAATAQTASQDDRAECELLNGTPAYWAHRALENERWEHAEITAIMAMPRAEQEAARDKTIEADKLTEATIRAGYQLSTTCTRDAK